MSFDDLQEADYSQKQTDIVIKTKDKDVKFKACEITYLQRLHLASLQQNGSDAFTQLIVYSIVDEDGRRMTIEQANKLPAKHAEKFFIAASEVNAQPVKSEKN